MSAPSQGIFVACTEAAVFVRVIGRGACRNSEPLRQFGLRKLQQGIRKIYVDLLRCEALDSTFLGVFAGFGLSLGEKSALILSNMTGSTLHALKTLGLDHIASVESAERAPEAFPPDSAFEFLPGTDLNGPDSRFDALERALLMLECHQDLCRIDERNEDKFREVKQFLREDIDRHGGSR
jgi:anti-anti-sigma regulatory factor